MSDDEPTLEVHISAEGNDAAELQAALEAGIVAIERGEIEPGSDPAITDVDVGGKLDFARRVRKAIRNQRKDIDNSLTTRRTVTGP